MATGGLGQAREGLEGEITCPLCLNIFEDPKILSCGHVYCKDPCLLGLAKQGNNTTITCPECRGVTRTEDGSFEFLRTDFRINRLKDLHKKIGKTPKTCSIHKNQELAIYCDTCKQVLCRDCWIDTVDHQGHDFQYIGKAAQNFRTNLLELAVAQHALQKTLSKSIVKLDDTTSDITKQQKAISKDIDTEAKRAVESLIEHRLNLQSKLTSTTTQKLIEVKAQEQEISTAHSKLSNSICAIENSVENLTDMELVLKANELKTVLEQASENAKQVSLSPASLVDIYLYTTKTTIASTSDKKQFYLHCGPVADPSKCTFDSQGIRNVTLDQTTCIHVRVCDSKGAKCVEEQNVSVELIYLRNLTSSVLNITYVEPGQYLIKFTPRTRGRHMFSIKVNGTHIIGSPTRMFVKISPLDLEVPVAFIPDLKHPAGLACSKEMLLVCEHGADQIAMIDQNFQKAGVLAGDLRGPAEMAIDSDSNIFVSTVQDCQVHKLDQNGKHLKKAGSRGKQPHQFDFPNGIYISRQKVFVCDSDHDHIKEYDMDLNLYRTIGKSGSELGMFNSPIDLSFNRNGEMFVTDKLNYRIQVLTSDGKPIRTFGSKGKPPGQLDYPIDIQIVDSHAYITELHNGRVSVFTCAGDFVTTFGKGYLSRPEGIAIDQDGFVYLTSHQNQIIVF